MQPPVPAIWQIDDHAPAPSLFDFDAEPAVLLCAVFVTSVSVSGIPIITRLSSLSIEQPIAAQLDLCAVAQSVDEILAVVVVFYQAVLVAAIAIVSVSIVALLSNEGLKTTIAALGRDPEANRSPSNNIDALPAWSHCTVRSAPWQTPVVTALFRLIDPIATSFSTD